MIQCIIQRESRILSVYQVYTQVDKNHVAIKLWQNYVIIKNNNFFSLLLKTMLTLFRSQVDPKEHPNYVKLVRICFWSIFAFCWQTIDWTAWNFLFSIMKLLFKHLRFRTISNFCFFIFSIFFFFGAPKSKTMISPQYTV